MSIKLSNGDNIYALRLVIVTIYNFNQYCLLVAATHHGISRTRNGVNISPKAKCIIAVSRRQNPFHMSSIYIE